VKERKKKVQSDLAGSRGALIEVGTEATFQPIFQGNKRSHCVVDFWARFYWNHSCVARANPFISNKNNCLDISLTGYSDLKHSGLHASCKLFCWEI
jgi:hypothetical protein